MAEAIAGLAVASSIIAVIDATHKVVTTGWKCYKGIRNPPKELLEVMSELMSLHGILEALRSHLYTSHDQNSKDSLALDVLNQPDGVLSVCAVVLQDVRRIIEGLRKKKLSSILAAATSGQKLLEAKGRIERLKGLLMLALSSDHLTLSHAVEEYLHLSFGGLQRGQEKIHFELLNIDNHITKLSRASDEMASAQKEKHEADRYYKTLRWLSTIDFEANHVNACRLQQPGTGLWLIEGEYFSEWAEKDNSTFWLHAIPGAGKTILCSTVIQGLQSRSQPIANKLGQPAKSTTVYFYFDFRDSEKQHTEGMLSSLLSQLANELIEVPKEICALWEMYKDKKRRPSLEELLSILTLVIKKYFDKVYIALEALDECSEHHIFLPILRQLMDSKCASIFLTSRGEDDIRKSLSKQSMYSAAIESADVALDVELFVNRQIKATESLRDLNVGLQNDIVQQLVRGAKGMFRWVVCQLDALKPLGRPKAIRNALKSLPQTLHETYDRILMGIQSEEEREHIRRTLQFIIFAARPMTIKEIAEAVVIEDNSTSIDPDDRFYIPEHLVKNVRSLLTITGGYLGLSHYTVQEYLQSPRISKNPTSYFAMTQSNADEEISRKCLTYLAYDDFNVGPCKYDDEIDSRLVDYPFLEYAASSWFIHAREEEAQQSVASLFHKIWTTVESPKYLSWYQVFGQFDNKTRACTIGHEYYGLTLADPPIVYYPALWGLHVLLEHLLIHGAGVNIRGGYYGQSLQAAAISQNHQCFNLLLVHGADVHAQGGHFGNALQASASVGCKDMVEALVKRNCRVDTEGGVYGNALYAASRYGHTDIICVLLEAGADVNSRGGPLGYPLQAAASNGHELACKILIDNGALVNAQEGVYGNAANSNGTQLNRKTARFTASRLRSLAFASLLSDMRVGARTPSLFATYLVEHQVNDIDLLRVEDYEDRAEDYSADDYRTEVNTKVSDCSTALHAACLNGHEQVVRLLLIHHADVSLIHHLYGTPLQIAAGNGLMEVIALLIHYKADVNQQGGHYANALQAAARNGHGKVVGALLALGADVNRVGGYYNSSLEAACQSGIITVVKMLLDHGADPNIHPGLSVNALQVAFSRDKGDIVQLLLERGAKNNTVEWKHWTARNSARKRLRECENVEIVGRGVWQCVRCGDFKWTPKCGENAEECRNQWEDVSECEDLSECGDVEVAVGGIRRLHMGT